MRHLVAVVIASIATFFTLTYFSGTGIQKWFQKGDYALLKNSGAAMVTTKEKNEFFNSEYETNFKVAGYDVELPVKHKVIHGPRLDSLSFATVYSTPILNDEIIKEISFFLKDPVNVLTMKTEVGMSKNFSFLNIPAYSGKIQEDSDLNISWDEVKFKSVYTRKSDDFIYELTFPKIKIEDEKTSLKIDNLLLKSNQKRESTGEVWIGEATASLGSIVFGDSNYDDPKIFKMNNLSIFSNVIEGKNNLLDFKIETKIDNVEVSELPFKVDSFLQDITFRNIPTKVIVQLQKIQSKIDQNRPETIIGEGMNILIELLKAQPNIELHNLSLNIDGKPVKAIGKVEYKSEAEPNIFTAIDGVSGYLNVTVPQDLLESFIRYSHSSSYGIYDDEEGWIDFQDVSEEEKNSFIENKVKRYISFIKDNYGITQNNGILLFNFKLQGSSITLNDKPLI